jgi:hypothetical protein
VRDALKSGLGRNGPEVLWAQIITDIVNAAASVAVQTAYRGRSLVLGLETVFERESPLTVRLSRDLRAIYKRASAIHRKVRYLIYGSPVLRRLQSNCAASPLSDTNNAALIGSVSMGSSNLTRR